MAKWWEKAVGEISRLRDTLGRLGWGFVGAKYGGTYKLDSSRVKYERARALYNNTDDDYKLGAGFAKPIINTTVGFMGIPQFKSKDEAAQKILDDFFSSEKTKMQRTQLKAIREGDCFVWITREKREEAALHPGLEEHLVYNIIPPEMVKKVNRNPISGEPVEYILESQHTWEDERGVNKRATIKQRISKEYRRIEIEGDVPPDIEPGEEPNPWGFIPIVHFKNEGDESEEFGKSDLEAVEPFLKAYHDVMLHAIQGSKMHSTPKLKLKLKDVAQFLENNFGVTDPVKFAREGGTIDLDGHDLLIFSDSEDAEFIEVRSAIGDGKVLLNLLFYCIVGVSETPEFAFGTHTPSSLSSVKEQMPVLIRKIERKREHFDEPWKQLARIVLAMTSQAEATRFTTYETTLEWDKIDPRTGKEIAEELEMVVRSLNTALSGQLISHEAAVQFLSYYINTMNDYKSDDEDVPGERDRILETRILFSRLEDGEGLGRERNLIELVRSNGR